MNWNRQMTITAKESLAGGEYCAIALNDGKYANNGGEASGILQVNDAANGDFIPIAYIGESFFKAGAAISAGDDLTVVQSGYFETAKDGDVVVGQCKDNAVTSGSIGRGVFSFPSGGAGDAAGYGVNPLGTVAAGAGYNLADNATGVNPAEFSGVAVEAMTSGTPARIAVDGVVQCICANSYGAGAALQLGASGFFTALTSGYVAQVKTLAAVASGTLADCLIMGGEVKLS